MASSHFVELLNGERDKLVKDAVPTYTRNARLLFIVSLDFSKKKNEVIITGFNQY